VLTERVIGCSPGGVAQVWRFLRQRQRVLSSGLIDEISLPIFPAVDGTKGAPCVFDSSDEEAGAAAPARVMALESSEVLEGGVVWLRHRLHSNRGAN
jgi:hypothetical protein